MSDFICTGCGKHAPIDTLRYKCGCGGLYKLNSDAPKFNPALVDQSEFSIFRYRRFMGIDTAKFREISMGEGLTASVKFGENLYLKLDYAMPTLSFKDRGAAVLVLHAKNIGVKKVLQDSSGNAGNAVAAYCLPERRLRAADFTSSTRPRLPTRRICATKKATIYKEIASSRFAARG